jgi:hypothetical protein
MQNNKAFSGAAIYSDNYELQLILSRSLVTGNIAYSHIGNDQNYISGGHMPNVEGYENFASSDLAGAVFYGEVVGPLPAETSPEAGNSIYDNIARFIVRLPDAPNTKGVLLGISGIGQGGVDTLRGNYWGRTDANVFMAVGNRKPMKIEDKDNDGYYEDTTWYEPAVFETFFVDSKFETKNYNSEDLRKQTHLRYTYMYNKSDPDRDPREQGPFESIGRYEYEPIPLGNQPQPYDENVVGKNSFFERLVMSGYVYDIYDKGTDIKVADVGDRSMVPVEDFAVGIPPKLRRYTDANYPSGTPDVTGNTNYVRRWIRDPFIVDSILEQDPDMEAYSKIKALQDEFRADKEGDFYHPIGYPLYIETEADYDGEAEIANHDTRLLNESVFFVINQTTSDFIRVALRQVSEEGPRREVFRARVEFVPDSTRRSTDYTYRRSVEGLLTFGDILTDLDKQPYNEDQSTLPGRRYHEKYNQTTHTEWYGNLSRIFSNRPDMPEDNTDDQQTFFAGERYGALPVNVGDVVRVISRTVLWREGGNVAWRDGLEFTISESTMRPEFTHEIPHLATDTIRKWRPSEYPWEWFDADNNPSPEFKEVIITDFLNRVFITEDRLYPYLEDVEGNGGVQFSTLPRLAGQGRDSILTVTAKDGSKFYDPRAMYWPEYYTQLTYKWSVENTSALKRWIQADTIWAARDADFRDEDAREDDALGFLEFRGKPLNFAVVPGGEKVTVIVENYPPHYRSTDVLTDSTLEKDDKDETHIPAQDTVDRWINIFPSYLHAGAYDVANARFLQQDTINSGKNYWQDYEYEIFVIDSHPRFFEPYPAPLVDEGEDYVDPDTTFVTRRLDGIYEDDDVAVEEATKEGAFVYYPPSIYTCLAEDGVLRANLTDSLRFRIDINTDDEMEDNSRATKAGFNGTTEDWDYRYGKTAYGFTNKAVRPEETVEMEWDENYFHQKLDTIINQTRPIWMRNDEEHQYVRRFGNTGEWDEFMVDFTNYGQLDVRINRDKALEILQPISRYASEYNTDTTFAIVVNDGHGGINVMSQKVTVNFKPMILTNTLIDAREDSLYNPELLDTIKRIVIDDANYDQWHNYQIVYSDEIADELGLEPLADMIPKDPCFPEAGYWDLTNLKTAPKWLRVNAESGMLYGVPGIDDAPRTESVTVLVTDEYGLNDLKTYELNVEMTNHNPKIINSPEVRCVDVGMPYRDTLYLTDKDLMRGIPGVDDNADFLEEVQLKVIQPASGLTVEPSVIKGIKQTDTVKFVVGTDNLDLTQIPRDEDGKITIVVEATDKAGAKYEFTYRLQVSDPTKFICNVFVENQKGAKQKLQFGVAEVNATTGEGLDGEEIGTLDYMYCEYELPPTPPTDVFDARWRISKTNGVQRNIFPMAKTGVEDERVYYASFQSGGEKAISSQYFPILISWDPAEIPALTDNVKNPTASSWHIQDATTKNGNIFSRNMKTGDGHTQSNIIFGQEGSLYTISIQSEAFEGFVIRHIWHETTSVEGVAGFVTELTNITPNPANGIVNIQYTLAGETHAKVEIIDAIGNIVAVVSDNEYTGYEEHNVTWNAKDLANGTYTVRLTAGSVTSTMKLVVVK